MTNALSAPAEGFWGRTKQSFGLFFGNLKELFLVPFLILLLGVVVVGALAFGASMMPAESVAGLILMILAGLAAFIFLIVYILAPICILSKMTKGQDVTFGDTLGMSWGFFGRFWGVVWNTIKYVVWSRALLGIIVTLVLYALWNTLAEMFGMLPSIPEFLNYFFFALGAFFMLWFYSLMLRPALGLVIAVDKDEYGKPAVKRSVSLINQRWWRTLGNILFMGIVIAVIVQLIGLAQMYFLPFPMMEDPTMIFSMMSVTVVLAIVINIIMSVFQIALQTTFYFLLYKRYEQEGTL